ncbi:hypothetical protein PHMEG_00012461 [Phytophthora megakarya]|uniref:Uncharacterized protein n=1 Tax=Phytophthora megakarya TaxID=4795 RepID=A0A225W946_9STRA|nr:hypothetical protein PHMEG_00012461 [Phytophthora megakarya]
MTATNKAFAYVFTTTNDDNVNLFELLSWSVELKRETSQPPHDEKEPLTREIQLINHQNAVISQLLETNKELSHRVVQLERRLCRPDTKVFQVNTRTIADTHGEVASSRMHAASTAKTCSSKTKGKSSSKSAQAVWFEWYTMTPRHWVSCNDRQYKSQTKQIVVFMRLFLPHSFKLDPSSSGYADSVLSVGKEAEQNMQCFLCSRGMKRKLGSGLLKHLRLLLREGALKELIAQYRARVAVGQIVDPAPEETSDSF